MIKRTWNVVVKSVIMPSVKRKQNELMSTAKKLKLDNIQGLFSRWVFSNVKKHLLSPNWEIYLDCLFIIALKLHASCWWCPVLLPHCRCTSISEDCFTSLKAELLHTKNVLLDLAPQAKTIVDVANALTPLKAAFPRVIALLQLTLTLPVSTASCERSFSCIKRVKTYTRTSMKENRLCGLALMSIENDITRDENFLDDVVLKFKNNSLAEGKQRRIAL